MTEDGLPSGGMASNVAAGMARSPAASHAPRGKNVRRVSRGAGICVGLAALWAAGAVVAGGADGQAVAPPRGQAPRVVQVAFGKPEGRYRSVAEVLARHEYEEERGLRFPELVRGNPFRRVLAITFDDGPHPLYTQELLAILKRERVTATFFVVGKMVDLYPQLVQQEAAEGHEVANHTYNHLRLPTLPPDQIESELRNGALAIQRAIGSPTRLYRPPGGEYDEDVIAATRRMDYVMVLWTDDPGDYAKPGAKVVEDRTLQQISDGGILLLHDGVQQTLDILPVAEAEVSRLRVCDLLRDGARARAYLDGRPADHAAGTVGAAVDTSAAERGQGGARLAGPVRARLCAVLSAIAAPPVR